MVNILIECLGCKTKVSVPEIDWDNGEQYNCGCGGTSFKRVCETPEELAEYRKTDRSREEFHAPNNIDLPNGLTIMNSPFTKDQWEFIRENEKLANHFAVKKAKQELFKDLEKSFDTDHICGCEKWCKCWEGFKAKHTPNDDDIDKIIQNMKVK